MIANESVQTVGNLCEVAYSQTAARNPEIRERAADKLAELDDFLDWMEREFKNYDLTEVMQIMHERMQERNI